MTRRTSKKGQVSTLARHGRGNTKRHRCQHCQKTFKPKRSDASYCSGRCRQAAFRARKGKTERIDFPARCAHCGAGYWSRNLKRKYCSASCRTLASRAKREAATQALAAWQGIDGQTAADLVDIGGLQLVCEALENNGFVYDQSARVWRQPAGAPLLAVGY